MLPLSATSAPRPKSPIISNSSKRKSIDPLSESIDRKRICPLKIAEVKTIDPSAMLDGTFSPLLSDSGTGISTKTTDNNINKHQNGNDAVIDVDGDAKAIKKSKEKTPLTEEFQKLLDACRHAEASTDMDTLINRKLLRYYQSVPSNFVTSKSFRKTINTTVQAIEAAPHLVYLKLTPVMEELITRRKNGDNVIVSDETTAASTGDERKDARIVKLNKALTQLTKKIAEFDAADVDWEEEQNSNFLISEKLKKRATLIYEKICDITGESKNAQRVVKKPIKFNDTVYSEFNRMLQNFVNETRKFPDMFDVLRILEHCNRNYDYRLNKENCKDIGKLGSDHINFIIILIFFFLFFLLCMQLKKLSSKSVNYCRNVGAMIYTKPFRTLPAPRLIQRWKIKSSKQN